jgi:hypothetical protein
MPTQPQTAIQKLVEDRRTAILGELRKFNPAFVKELVEIDSFLACLKSKEGGNEEYCGFRSPLKAILTYLDRVDHAVVKQRISKDVADGGYGKGQLNNPYNMLMDTIRYHLKKKTGAKIIERNGLVGKAGWPDKLFELEESNQDSGDQNNTDGSQAPAGSL